MAVVSLGNLWSTVAGIAFGNGLLTGIQHTCYLFLD